MARRLLTPAPTRDDLIRAARARFLAGERLDLSRLADEVGISRATAYRWIGNADALIGSVVADIAEQNFRRAVAASKGEGATRILDAMERGMRAIVASRPYRQFLERDPQRALRIVASKEGPAQARTIALHQHLIEEEVARGALVLPVDSHTMAYALVRTAESFIYADLIVGEKPDVAKAVQILRLLLGAGGQGAAVIPSR